ncbi:MAG: sodium ion-translocating decarboxylase subunit beta, partial [Prolixibacteraceae bacterium]|nr:sodium ion-translocating decarboxylase subunit beta [Prolixibacteraceae bacterium]
MENKYRKSIVALAAVVILLTLQAVFGWVDAWAAVAPGADAAASQGAHGGALEGLRTFWNFTGFANFDFSNLIMIVVGLFFIFLAIKYDYEPLLLVPIGTGILLGNIPFVDGYQVGIYEEGSVMNYLYFGVKQGIYPPLIFLGIGAMTDFSSLISNPKLMLLGAAAQIGIFATFLGATALGFAPNEAGAIGIIGGADGPTAIFLSAKLAPHLMGAIAIAA